MIDSAKLRTLRTETCADCWHRDPLRNAHCLDERCGCRYFKPMSGALLAAKAGLSRQAVNRLEGQAGQKRGEDPKYSTVVALAKALNVEPSDLIMDRKDQTDDHTHA